MKRYAIGERTKSRRWGRIIVVLGVVFLLILGGAAVAVHDVYENNLKPLSASQKRMLFTVKSGASAKDIARSLKQQGFIKADWAFEWYVRNHNLRDALEAGTYYLSPSQDVPSIAAQLTEGRVATDLITILPGQRLDQIRKALINDGFSAQEVDDALNPDHYKDNPALVDKPEGASLEGYLYPDSFQKTATTKASTIIEASLDEMAEKLTPDVRAKIERQGLTVYQGIILASIVSQEVSKVADKPTVAQVFLTRFRQNMQLGSDVTAFYGAIVAGKEPSVGYDSVYNTRIRNGLPPSPISNVRDVDLNAVANPSNTDYLYFVAGDDGITYFSHTLAEHEALTRQHCTTLCQ